ncbi:hypothetical protein F4861DRAFT_502599 [Xylaria intraflava]|nr:hypothetical protein F4861DRAFT_502599 [Xylaria intraflava]
MVFFRKLCWGFLFWAVGRRARSVGLTCSAGYECLLEYIYRDIYIMVVARGTLGRLVSPSPRSCGFVFHGALAEVGAGSRVIRSDLLVIWSGAGDVPGVRDGCSGLFSDKIAVVR